MSENILQLTNISLDYGKAPLLNKANLQIKAKEHICLIGRNGTGKSSLLKIISGLIQPDEGEIFKTPHLKISTLDQILLEKDKKTVFDIVGEGLSTIGKLLQKYHHHLEKKQNFDNNQSGQKLWLIELEKIQKEIEQKHGWQYEQKIQSILSQLNLSGNSKMKSLSGGWRRRVALARALVCEPDLLLLDEPTNHLDIDCIIWFENYLKNFKGAILCISHDRTLVNKIATRIIELDRGNLYSTKGNYQNFIKTKEKRLEDETQQAKKFDKKLAKEETWIRQGIKARRTRNEGRVRALKKLRNERQERRELLRKPSFNFSKSELSGKLVIDAKNVCYKYDNKPLIEKFSLKIFRGDRIGIIGPNGCGKTTLLRLLLDKLKPQSGTVKLGTNMQIAYFDQLKAQINPELTVMENVAHGRTAISINGREKHIISYLSDFLFTPEQSMAPVNRLSGGEQNRLLLARLFSLPANLLVLDEPTNDLDIETLELLEEILINYDGTILLVSHDRNFMDNVITQILAFEENGDISEYVGSYSDWLLHSENLSDLPKHKPKIKTKIKIKIKQKTKTLQKSQSKLKDVLNNTSNLDHKLPKSTTRISNKKLSYKLQRELDNLPDKIEKLEQKINSYHKEIALPEFYQQSENEITKKLNLCKQAEADLEKALKRWQELES